MKAARLSDRSSKKSTVLARGMNPGAKHGAAAAKSVRYTSRRIAFFRHTRR